MHSRLPGARAVRATLPSRTGVFRAALDMDALRHLQDPRGSDAAACASAAVDVSGRLRCAPFVNMNEGTRKCDARHAFPVFAYTNVKTPERLVPAQSTLIVVCIAKCRIDIFKL